MHIEFNITHGKDFAKIFSTFDVGKTIDVKELLSHRTTVRNSIRI